MAEIRNFETGATRDTDQGKLDYEGFLHPAVLERFAQYMHTNRIQKDGSVRDSDNWQKGIPTEAYMKSLMRHTMDVWAHHRERPDLAKEDLETALCAVMFNAMGMLYEELLKPSQITITLPSVGGTTGNNIGPGGAANHAQRSLKYLARTGTSWRRCSSVAP